MRHNNFSVRIIGGKEDGTGYVEIDHGTQYSIRLANFRNVACDAKIVVDGKDCGTFRISSFGHFLLERPGHDDGKFTAYVAGTSDAVMAGINPRDPNTGLVQVTFTPAKYILRQIHTYYSNTDDADTPRSITTNVTSSYTLSTTGGDMLMGAVASAAPVGTGLSGKSNQSFYDVPPLDYDYSQQTVIHLRLISPRDNGPRPLTSYSTPIPPPVGLR